MKEREFIWYRSTSTVANFFTAIMLEYHSSLCVGDQPFVCFPPGVWLICLLPPPLSSSSYSRFAVQLSPFLRYISYPSRKVLNFHVNPLTLSSRLRNPYFSGQRNSHCALGSDKVPEPYPQIRLYSVRASYHRLQKSLYSNLFYCIME